jgi:ribosomal protein L29
MKKKVRIENLYSCQRFEIENLSSYKILNKKNTLNIDKLANKSIIQLEKELKKQRKIYNELKFIHYTFFYQNPMKLRLTRKLIAKILTILSYKKKYNI